MRARPPSRNESDRRADARARQRRPPAVGWRKGPSRSTTLAALRRRSRRPYTVLDRDYRPMLWREDAAPWYREAAELATVIVGNAGSGGSSARRRPPSSWWSRSWAAMEPGDLASAGRRSCRRSPSRSSTGSAPEMRSAARSATGCWRAGLSSAAALRERRRRARRVAARLLRRHANRRRGRGAPVRGLTKLAPGSGNVAMAQRPEPSAAPGTSCSTSSRRGSAAPTCTSHDGEYPARPPVTMGHEVSGVVAELGDGVDRSWRGARVVTETYFSTCGHCDWCRAGRTEPLPRAPLDRHARRRRLRAAPARPRANLHRIPDWLDAHAAAMTEPLACCCQSLLDPDRVGEGDRVLVVGPGPIGLLAAQVARAAGGDVHVRGTPRDAARLERRRSARIRDLDDRRRRRGRLRRRRRVLRPRGRDGVRARVGARAAAATSRSASPASPCAPVRPRLLQGADDHVRVTRRRRRRGSARSS